MYRNQIKYFTTQAKSLRSFLLFKWGKSSIIVLINKEWSMDYGNLVL